MISPLRVSLFLIFLLLSNANAQTWNGTTDALWATATNWSTAATPGSGQTATFDNAGDGNIAINLGGAAHPIGTIVFDTAAVAGYSFSGNAGDAFVFDPSGAITRNAAVTNSQVFNTPLQLLGAFTVTNSSTSGSLTLNGGISLAAGGSAGLLTVNTTGSTAINGVIDAGAISGLTKSGTGTLTLGAANLFTGTTSITGGTLALGVTNALPTTSPIAFSGTSTLALGANNQTMTVFTVPTNAAATTTITGTGTLTLTGGANLQIGPTATVTSAMVQTLNMSGLSAFVFNNSANNINTGIANTNSGALATISTWTMAASNTITANTFIVAGGGGNNNGGTSIVNLGATNTLNVNGINIGTSNRANGQLRFASAGSMLTVRNPAGTAAMGTWSIGQVQTFDNTTWTNTVDFTNGTVDIQLTTMNIATAANGTAATRAGTSIGNFLIGAGTLTAGTLNIGNITGTTGTLLATAIFTANGTLTINNANAVVNATTINFATNTIQATAGTTRSVTGTLNLTSGLLRATNIQLGAQTGTATAVTRNFNWTTGTIENTAGADLNITNVPITLLTTGTHTFNVTGVNSIIQAATSPISGTNFSVTKTGPGTLSLNAVNTYSGGLTINDGTVLLNAGATLGAATAPLTLASPGILNLNGVDATVGVFSGTGGTITSTSTPAMFTAGTAANSTFAGNIDAAAGITKAGTGTLTLSGVHTFNGPTIINAGTLQFNSAPSAASGLALNAGGNLILANGAGNNLTSLPSLSLASGTGNSQITLQLATPATSDHLGTTATAITGSAANTLVLNFTALPGFGVGTYPLFSASGGLTTGGLNYSFGTLPPGFAYNLLSSDTLISLDVFTVIPSSGPIYWTGGTNSKWNQTAGGNAVNFATNLAGTTIMTGSPNSTNTVIYSASNANVGNTIVSTIESNFTINDLVFNNETASGAITAISIDAGVVSTSTLTITPTSNAVGISVQAGAPATISLSAPLSIGAANQTWTITDALNSLTISGGVTGTANLVVAGNGSLFLNNVGTAFSGNLQATNAAVSFGGTAATTISGVISGTAAIFKADTSTVTFGSTNTYTGSTTLTGGTLAVNSIADGGVNSGIGASSNAATNLVFNGGTLSIAGTNSTNRNMTVDIGGGTIILATDGSTLTLNGSLTGAGTFTFGALASPVGGTSTINLNGDSSSGFTGNFRHYSGNLIIRNANVLGSGTKTIEAVASTPALMQFRLDGSGGDITLPASFSFVTSGATGANGIYSIAGNNTIAGSISLTAGNGNTAFYAAAGATLTLAGNITILTGQTSRGITLGGAGNGFLTGSVSDNGTALASLTKNADSGTWTVSSPASTYTGNTIILGGTLKAGSENAFSSGSRLFFGDQSANVGTFDMNNFNQQFNGLSAQVNNAAGATLLISPGKTLTITGATVANVVNIGSISSANVSTTRLNVVGPTGTLTVNDPTRNIVVAQLITATGTNSPSIFDLTGLGTLNATVTNVYVGRPTAAAGTAATTSSAEAAQFLLAGNSTVTASGNFVIGHLSFSSGAPNSGLVRMGTTSVFNVNQWVIAGGRANGTLNYQTGLTNPTTVLRGAAGGTTRTNMILGDQANASGVGGGGGSTQVTGTVDFTGGSVDALFDTLVIGNGATVASSAFGRGNGALTFGAGTVDVNTLILARNVSGTTTTTLTNAPVSIATLTINGGNLTVNTAATLALDQDITGGGIQDLSATLTLNAGTVTIGATATPVDLTLGTHTSSNPGTNTVLVTVNGGTLNIHGNIVSGSTGSGVNNATVTLAGGTIDLNGFNLGTPAGLITTLDLRTGTLRNVAEINGGGGIIKSTPGTLILAGTNTFTGSSTVNNGTLQVTGTTGPGSITVDGGITAGTLRGTGTIGGPVTVNGGAVAGTIRAGNSIGTMTLANGLLVNGGGQIYVELAGTAIPAAVNSGGSTVGPLNNPTSNNFLNITGGFTSIDPGTVIVIDAAGASFSVGTTYSYKIGQGAGFQGFSITNPGQFVVTGIDVDPSSLSFTGNAAGDLFVNFTATAIPEPAFLAGTLLLTGVLFRRKR